MKHQSLNLQAYFERIAYAGGTQPGLELLNDLMTAHVQAVPFENIDVLLGRPIRLEPDALFDKMVTRQRGGYCFEQNGLFLLVLQQLGFAVRPMSARVRLGQPDRQRVTQRTHLLLEVRLQGGKWLVDVGVGSASLTSALRWQEDVVQQTSHDARRIQREAGCCYHQIKHGEKWVDVCEFSGETMPFVDRKVGNWYTSTHPDSTFCQQLMLAVAAPQGRRVSLNGRELKISDAQGRIQQMQLANSEELGNALRDYFGLHLPAADCHDLNAMI